MCALPTFPVVLNAQAELAYPWFISIFSQLHDFGLFYDLEYVNPAESIYR